MRPNQYEPGRANLIVYNWAGLPSVNVDPGEAGLKIGACYEIRDAQNYLDSPLVSGVYDGNAVRLPVLNRIAAKPLGDASPTDLQASPEFGIFILLPSSKCTNDKTSTIKRVMH